MSMCHVKAAELLGQLRSVQWTGESKRDFSPWHFLGYHCSEAVQVHSPLCKMVRAGYVSEVRNVQILAGQ